MRKFLLVITLICSVIVTNAQCVYKCGEPQKPCSEVNNVTVQIYNGTTLLVGFDHVSSATECSYGILAYVNGVPYTESGNFPWGTGTNGGIVPGYSVTPGETICVVVRNYCESTQHCANPLYYESTEICITAPIGNIPCRCNPNGQKYVIQKQGFENRCVTKNKCLQMLLQGWTSSCNCI